MNLKRERSEDAGSTRHARKKQKMLIRLPIIPKVKEEKEDEPFVAYNHLDTIEYLYENDEEWKCEDDDHVKCHQIRTPKTKRRSKNRGPKKETSFRNIFWGTQQLAWMGSVRVKGTIVRSCSRRSDVLAAKILNTRCKSKGIAPPNPEVGFLTSDELACRSNSQGRSRGKKKTGDRGAALGKQNRNLPKKQRKKAKRGPSSPFKNIFWGTQQKAWMGNIRVKGTIVRSCSRKSDVQAAKILNSRCREKGIDPPNPDVGYIDSKLESKYLSGSKNRKTERANHPPVSGQYINDRNFLGKNKQMFYPLDTVKTEKDLDFTLEETDRTCSTFKVKVEPEDPYRNVFWSSYEQAWIGSYETASGRVLTVKSQENALMAARMLNSACRDACILNPNPHAGYLTNDEPSSPDFRIKAEPPAIDDSFNDDFQDLFKPFNDISTCRSPLSLETVELPPPVLDDVDFKAMNNLMFKYISDLLPEHTRIKHHQDRTSSLFDDLPLNSILL